MQIHANFKYGTHKKYWLTFSPSDGMKAACVQGAVCYNEVRNRIKPSQGVIVTARDCLFYIAIYNRHRFLLVT